MTRARRVLAREAGQGRCVRAVEAEELRDGQHRGAHFPGRRAGGHRMNPQNKLPGRTFDYGTVLFVEYEGLCDAQHRGAHLPRRRAGGQGMIPLLGQIS